MPSLLLQYVTILREENEIRNVNFQAPELADLKKPAEQAIKEPPKRFHFGKQQL
jgi:hypothetical protein